MYTLIITKNFIIKLKKISPIKYKKLFVLVNLKVINLSVDELRLIAQLRNISDYENKSEEDLIKALSEPKTRNTKTRNKIKTKNSKTKTKTRNKS